VALGIFFHGTNYSGGPAPVRLPISRIIEMLTIGPARALGLPGGTLSIGSLADVTIFEPDLEWTVEPGLFKSRCRNTPFAGWHLKGRAVATFVGGRAVFRLDR
jgi:dihydroorotase